ncbi:hypothetical protein [Sphingomonas sp.]|uniref:hypothetical protein n=1 Tax=Sphingomonas sp. TaxID=28214 RepID=UPI00286BB62F|nr:hypothetical protein [Sphingomonas sp.]
MSLRDFVDLEYRPADQDEHHAAHDDSKKSIHAANVAHGLASAKGSFPPASATTDPLRTLARRNSVRNMNEWRRAFVVAGSVGWIVPLCLAIVIGRDFAWLTFQIANGQAESPPWHCFELLPALFFLSMAWLATVVICWTFTLTGKR